MIPDPGMAADPKTAETGVTRDPNDGSAVIRFC
jgi:hypothetical protein